jgi:hypothetical protein
MTYTGGCHCGAVRYEVRGTPQESSGDTILIRLPAPGW